MKKIWIVLVLVFTFSGCTTKPHCGDASITDLQFFWQDSNSTVSDCNDSEKNLMDDMVIDYRPTVIAQCKKDGFLGYVENKNDLKCSNGEIKDGCIVTSTGVMCGDSTFTYIDQRK